MRKIALISIETYTLWVLNVYLIILNDKEYNFFLKLLIIKDIESTIYYKTVINILFALILIKKHFI